MRLQSVNLQKIKINDAFWSKHVNLVKDAIIPYQWNAMNDRIYRMQNPLIVLRTLKSQRGGNG